MGPVTGGIRLASWLETRPEPSSPRDSPHRAGAYTPSTNTSMSLLSARANAPADGVGWSRGGRRAFRWLDLCGGELSGRQVGRRRIASDSVRAVNVRAVACLPGSWWSSCRQNRGRAEVPEPNLHPQWSNSSNSSIRPGIVPTKGFKIPQRVLRRTVLDYSPTPPSVFQSGLRQRHQRPVALARPNCRLQIDWNTSFAPPGA